VSTAGSSLRVVVFGGAGFLGSFVADALSDAGHDVVIFDREPSPYLRGDQTGIVGDILDEAAVGAAVEGCDVIYNYAGIADIEEASERPLETVRANVLGCTVILEAARRAGVSRYIFASTLYVYSVAGSFYRCSKQAAELIIENYQRAYGLPYTILRYGSLYGPRVKASNWIWSLLRDALITGEIRREGDGSEVREFVHVWDAAASSVDVLTPEFENTHVTISGQQTITIRDLLLLVQGMLERPVDIRYVPGDPLTVAKGLHYRVSPYSFNPKIARKMMRSSYVDLGQGLLELMGDVHRAERLQADDVTVSSPEARRSGP